MTKPKLSVAGLGVGPIEILYAYAVAFRQGATPLTPAMLAEIETARLDAHTNISGLREAQAILAEALTSLNALREEVGRLSVYGPGVDGSDLIALREAARAYLRHSDLHRGDDYLDADRRAVRLALDAALAKCR